MAQDCTRRTVLGNIVIFCRQSPEGMHGVRRLRAMDRDCMNAEIVIDAFDVLYLDEIAPPSRANLIRCLNALETFYRNI